MTKIQPISYIPRAGEIDTGSHARQTVGQRRVDPRSGRVGIKSTASGARGYGKSLLALSSVLLCLCVLAPQAFAEDQPAESKQIKHQITGLFMPEREQDLGDLFVKLPQFKLVSVDYPNAEAVLEYDPAKLWPNDPPEKYVERFNEQLRNASRGTFGAKPLRKTPLEKLKQIEIPVVGLDCKGCSYAAYELIFKLPGVERATSSFKAGKVTALIDPEQTDQAKLEEALKKGGVELQVAASE